MIPINNLFFYLFIVKSNAKVQILALELDFIQLILKALTKFSMENKSLELCQRLIFVLSGILRNFPLAQNHFVNKYGGVEVLSYFIENNNSIKLKTKILTLINDLIQEKVINFNY